MGGYRGMRGYWNEYGTQKCIRESIFDIKFYKKNYDFWQNGKKITFLVKKKKSWTAYKTQFWLKNAELLENHVKTKV